MPCVIRILSFFVVDSLNLELGLGIAFDKLLDFFVKFLISFIFQVMLQEHRYH